MMLLLPEIRFFRADQRDPEKQKNYTENSLFIAILKYLSK